MSVSVGAFPDIRYLGYSGAKDIRNRKLHRLYSGITNGGGATPIIIGGGAALLGAWFIKMGEPWKASPALDIAGLSQQLANIRGMMARG